MGNQSESALIQDLKHTSLVECLGRLSQIEELRSTNLSVRRCSDFRELEAGLCKLLQNDDSTRGDTLTLKSIFQNRPVPASGLEKYQKLGKFSIDQVLSAKPEASPSDDTFDDEYDAQQTIKLLDHLTVKHKNNLEKLKVLNESDFTTQPKFHSQMDQSMASFGFSSEFTDK